MRLRIITGNKEYVSISLGAEGEAYVISLSNQLGFMNCLMVKLEDGRTLLLPKATLDSSVIIVED